MLRQHLLDRNDRIAVELLMDVFEVGLLGGPEVNLDGRAWVVPIDEWLAGVVLENVEDLVRPVDDR